MPRLTTVLGYGGAVLTLAVLVGVPALDPAFTKAVAATGVRIDPVYSGGELARSIPRGGYRIDVNRPVAPSGLIGGPGSFVQLAWRPVAALPARIADEVDVDGDGEPELRAEFAIPADPEATLYVDVTPLDPRVRAMTNVSRHGLGALIARVGDAVVLRVPFAAR